MMIETIPEFLMTEVSQVTATTVECLMVDYTTQAVTWRDVQIVVVNRSAVTATTNHRLSKRGSFLGSSNSMTAYAWTTKKNVKS